MKEVKQTKEQLEKRRGEIEKQLNLVNQEARIELDNDIEEQAGRLSEFLQKIAPHQSSFARKTRQMGSGQRQNY